MTSAYGATTADPSSTGRELIGHLQYIPWEFRLKNGEALTIDFVRDEADITSVKKLLNDVIEEGMSWPFEEPLSETEFRNYFLSYAALVARNGEGTVIGAFYCKPNFPGRCSHYCNGGFITEPLHRGQGVALCMGKAFLRVAKDLGFQAVLFNLVFTSNVASMKLWDKLGFRRLARLPKVGRLRDGNFDAIQYYYDLENTNEAVPMPAHNFLAKAMSFFPQFFVCALFFVAGRLSRASSSKAAPSVSESRSSLE